MNFKQKTLTTMVKKSKSILWTAVAAGAMLSTASLFASCNTESKEVGTETHGAAGDSTAEHKCGTEHKCGGDSTKAEGKCGTDHKCGADSTKAEGKCGASKTKDAKCGEGKCGADKK